MPLLSLDIPSGVWRNGTIYQAKNRWYDANLVRFYDKQVRPIGGWTAFSATTVTGKARAILPWIDSSGLFWCAVGTNSHLYVYSRGGAQTDITPSGFTAGGADAVLAGGYGGSTYGTGTYGTARGGSPTLTPACVWTLDNLEQFLVGCTIADGKLYKWDLNTAHLAAVVDASAPTANRAVMVTEEGFIFALGAGGDPRNIQWPDQTSFSDWTPSDINQARQYALQTPGQIMCGTRLKGGAVIFTTTDVHLAVYAGLPAVYGFSQIGSGCGIISQQAYAKGEDFVAWMSLSGFWQYDGTVRAVESDVGDYVFGRLNMLQRSKVFAVHNATYGEIWWFYPSASSNEIDSYVVWNYREPGLNYRGHWTVGSLARTCAAEAGVNQYPVMVDTSGAVWNHENGLSYSGAGAIYAESGPIELGAGDNTYDIVYSYPDALTLGDVTRTFYSRFYPLGAETAYGPYSAANPTSLRVPGREIRQRLTGQGGDFRVGVDRLDVRPAGLR